MVMVVLLLLRWRRFLSSAYGMFVVPYHTFFFSQIQTNRNRFRLFEFVQWQVLTVARQGWRRCCWINNSRRGFFSATTETIFHFFLFVIVVFCYFSHCDSRFSAYIICREGIVCANAANKISHSTKAQMMFGAYWHAHKSI